MILFKCMDYVFCTTHVDLIIERRGLNVIPMLGRQMIHNINSTHGSGELFFVSNICNNTKIGISLALKLIVYGDIVAFCEEIGHEIRPDKTAAACD